MGDVFETKGIIFAFEIPPFVFELANKEIIQKMIDEGFSTNKFLHIDDDNNNGLSRDWIRVPVMMTKIKKA